MKNTFWSKVCKIDQLSMTNWAKELLLGLYSLLVYFLIVIPIQQLTAETRNLHWDFTTIVDIHWYQYLFGFLMFVAFLLIPTILRKRDGGYRRLWGRMDLKDTKVR